MLVAICGMAGSGKSTVTDHFERIGWKRIHLGSTEEVIRRYGYTNEKLEREVRNEMRQKHGMGAMAVLALPQIQKYLEQKEKVIVDNMYSWSEYKIFKQEFDTKFITIAVHAKPAVRYARLKTRSIRPQDIETSIERDYSEIEEIEKGGPIAMADFNIINEGTQSELDLQIDKILQDISNLLK